MILWVDGCHGARENMRRDSALLVSCANGALPDDVLRLFQFRPAGITLGNSQDPGIELDLARLNAAGIEWASRPTGGRAIWHDEEWTISLCAALGPQGWARTPAGAYERTCQLLARALSALGVPIELSAGSRRGVGSPRQAEGAAAPCFASTARHELTLDGRKCAGIAQRLVRGALLQQGSLLLGPSHLELAEWLRVPLERREAVRATLASSAADAGAYLPATTPLAVFADAISAHCQVERRLDGEEGIFALGLSGQER